jgi:cytidylate kinase
MQSKSLSDLREIVAIDGPAGVGKSSVAREVARRLGFAFLDTGAMYRAATWWALETGVNLEDPVAVAAATRAMPLEMREENGRPRVLVGGRDVSEAIRTEEVTRQICHVDQVPEVRAHLVELQRKIGAQRPTVAEGRDMATVVFPRAKCKIFIDASLDARARRRWLELKEKGEPVDYEALRADLHARDEHNRNRKVAPLRPAEDAVVLDTTDMNFEQVVEAVVRLARNAL